MGSGLSSIHRSSASLHQPPPASSPAAAAPPALVISADGSLKQFSAPPLLPVSVSDVLAAASSNAAADDDGRRRLFFVCRSDALYFDADVPALGADELLRPGQIYFVLPAAMLGRPLSSADMAKLAVRASEALAAARAGPAPPRGGGLAGRRRPRRGCGGFIKARVVPAHHAADGDEEVNEKLNQRTLGGFFETASRGGPTSNSTRNSDVAARSAPPVRRMLSTIEEDAE